MSETGTYTGLNSGFKKKNFFYLKEGSNLYRILPPFASMAKSGGIVKYWGVFWLAASKGKRPVPTILVQDKNKNVITRDPLAEKIDMLKANLTLLEKDGGATEIVEALKETVKSLRLDKSHYLNVINPAGEIGVLKIKYTGLQDLKERLKELAQQNFDPINAGPNNGLFFDFKKLKDDQGKVNYRVDIATKVTKNPNGPGFLSEYYLAPIDETVLNRMTSEASDLNSLYTVRTPEEQAQLANLDTATVDRIFSRAEEVVDDVAGDDEDSGITVPQATTAPTAKPSTAAVQAAVGLVTAPAPTQAFAPSQAVNVPQPSSVSQMSSNTSPEVLADRVKAFLNSGKL